MYTKYYSNTRIPNKFHLQVKNIKQSRDCEEQEVKK